MSENDRALRQKRLLFACSLFFIAGFLASCILSFCGVLTPAVSGIIAVACLCAFMVLNGISQRKINPTLCKVDFLTAALLVIVIVVLIVLLATGLWA